MYESIRIQNFRGIEDLTISDLGRVNLIVGANNVGKSSVLEALAFLHFGDDPLEFVRLATRRSSWPYGVPIRLLASLVANRDWGRPARITAQLPPNRRSTGLPGRVRLEMGIPGVTWYESDRDFSPAQNRRLGVHVEGLATGDSVTLNYLATPGVRYRFSTTPEVVEANVDPQTGATSSLWSEPVFGPSSSSWSWLSRSEEELSTKFSKIDASGDASLVLHSLARLEPRLARVFIAAEEYALGSGRMRTPVPTIRLLLDGNTAPVPPSLLGSGLHRLLQLFVLALEGRDGVLLVDEIDDGIYYENLPTMWSVINDLSSRCNSQLFATTHSWECVSSAVKSFEGSPDQFRLHRLDRRGDETTVTTYAHEDAEAALELNVEVR